MLGVDPQRRRIWNPPDRRYIHRIAYATDGMILYGGYKE